MPPFDPKAVRKIFPAIASSTNTVVYLDSAATTQKPQTVIDCLQEFYTHANGGVNRSTHSLALAASRQYDEARQTVAKFIGAKADEIIFTRGATEGLNLIAHSFGLEQLNENDEIIVSEMEHHANIVPWQEVAKKAGAKIVPWRMNKASCTLDLNKFDRLLTDKTRLVAIAHTSNVTGTRHPIEQVIAKAHQAGAVVVLDCAQGIVHEKIDVQKLNADFLVFSGHKLFAPTGIGILYGKTSLLEKMPPWQTGGKMIASVSLEQTSFAPPPARFEAGTPNTAGAIALGRAINWYQQFSQNEIDAYIKQLRDSLITQLNQIEGMNIIGLQPKSSVVAFNINGIHHNDLTTLLNSQGIAVRSGQHCAEPLMQALGLKGCVRISIALYNNKEDILRCVKAIKKALQVL